MLGGLTPGALLAGYQVEGRIGAGGMAVVFRARDERLHRTVALKVLAPALAGDDEFRERFIRESRAAAAVDHPHIIPVYAAGEADGVLYIAMRFVAGGDLRSVVYREGPLAADRAAFLISPVASALDAAHAAGLVHRDVKLANILVDTSPGRPDHPYLSDFGLSKGAASSAGLTGTGQFLGTPDFSAPEQISGDQVYPQTDQYTLACVAFTMLTGRVPFARDQPMAVLWAHMSEPPPSVTALRPDLSYAVDQALGRALAKDPGDRFGSCGQFADALRAALGVGTYAVPAASGGLPGTGFPGTRRSEPAGFTPATPMSPVSWVSPTTPAGDAGSTATAGVQGARHARPAELAPQMSDPWSPPTGASGALTTATTGYRAARQGDGAGSSAPADEPTTSMALRSRGVDQVRGNHAHARGKRSRRRLWVAAGVAAVVVVAGAAAGAAELHRPPRTAKADSAGVSGTAKGASSAAPTPQGSDVLTAPVLAARLVARFHAPVTGAGPAAGVDALSDSTLSAGYSTGSGADYAYKEITWDIATKARLPMPASLQVVSVSGDDRTAACSASGDSGGSSLEIWDIAAQQEISTLNVGSGVEAELSSVGTVATLDSSVHAIEVRSISTGDLIATLSYPAQGALGFWTISDDGSTVAAMTKSGVIYVWDTATASLVTTFRYPGSNAKYAIPYLSADGQTLATWSPGDNSYVWSVSGHAVLLRSLTSEILAISPDGKFLVVSGNVVSGSADGATVLNVRTDKVVLNLTAPGENEAVTAVFSPDATMIAESDSNFNIYVWRISASSRL